MSSLNAFSMWDLFRGEVESQMRVLTDGLLALEAGGDAQAHLAAAMRAAHSIKGAARIVQLDVGVRLSHVMEDCLVAAQEGALALQGDGIDLLLASGDLLSRLSAVEESAVQGWVAEQASAIDGLVERLGQLRAGTLAPTVAAPAPAAPGPAASGPVAPIPQPAPLAPEPAPAPASASPSGVAGAMAPAGAPAAAPAAPAPAPAPVSAPAPGPTSAPVDAADRSLKIGAQTLNRLIGLAGEAVVQTRWFEPFGESLLALKRRQQEVADLLDAAQARAEEAPAEAGDLLSRARHKLESLRQSTSERHLELETFALRSARVLERLHREMVTTRMRPFGDGVEGFPRLVRDVSRQLGKQVRLEILGRETHVDRDILDRLEAPLTHMIRNCLDHGLETPDVRTAAGKPPAGTIRVEARHRAGHFALTVSDDGRGVDFEQLRAKIVDRGFVTAEMAAQLSEGELIEFLFLPGFTTAKAVSDLSGRGVGLDAVREMAKSVGGTARLSSRRGQGITLSMELPLTLSVVRTLLTEIGGEPFAFPLTRIAKTVTVAASDLISLEGQQHFMLDGERVGVVPAHEVLEMASKPNWSEEIPIVLVGERPSSYGLAVDRFLGERDMVVQPLDTRLGKIRDVSSLAIAEDGSPVLILDVDDLVRSLEMQLQEGRLRGLGRVASAAKNRRRILVVDDSITVREVERTLLTNRGYEVDVAVDGVDGWNALRTGRYDLTVSDVDMPRMTGIELVSRVKADARLKTMPVIIVSYKDREEDRLRGLEAGADRYMTKNSFHDETLLSAVLELIGPPV
ncbi:MAG: response regulator [Vicinamibacterales bacterium]